MQTQGPPPPKVAQTRPWCLRHGDGYVTASIEIGVMGYWGLIMDIWEFSPGHIGIQAEIYKKGVSVGHTWLRRLKSSSRISVSV